MATATPIRRPAVDAARPDLEQRGASPAGERFTRAAIHCEAGELELALTPAGNWQLKLRAREDNDWRLACSGDIGAGRIAVPPTAAPPIRLGKLVLDRPGRRLAIDGSEVKLGVHMFDLLATLASQPERVFTKAELMRDVWGCEYLRSSRTLENHASKLRARLARAGAPGLIINCHGVGYKLWQGVELVPAS